MLSVSLSQTVCLSGSSCGYVVIHTMLFLMILLRHQMGLAYGLSTFGYDLSQVGPHSGWTSLKALVPWHVSSLVSNNSNTETGLVDQYYAPHVYPCTNCKFKCRDRHLDGQQTHNHNAMLVAISPLLLSH